MSWQKCPVCDGCGVTQNLVHGGSAGASYPACLVCNGEKIIHVDSGRPPSAHKLQLRSQSDQNGPSTRYHHRQESCLCTRCVRRPM